MKKPINGEVFGCRDGDAPQWYTDWELSRAYDLLYSSREFGF